VRVLAVDTALDACSAALVEDGRALAMRTDPMQRGHQERLAPLVAEVLAEAGAEPASLDRIGVVTGPGSFTGLRVGLAFAKGLGLALARPVVGIGTLEALGAGAKGRRVASVIDAKRGQVYLQAFCDNAPAMQAAILDIEDAIRVLIKLDPGGPDTLTGPDASLLAQAFPNASLYARQIADPALVARLAAARSPADAPPQPLYLRAPDARLPA
jgi:tRNA threonylcarbamoyladenosine biosynthesis protein TsaB